MRNHGIEEYRPIILDKLKVLERKLRLSITGQNDPKKVDDTHKNIIRVRQDLVKLNEGELSWEDLRIYNLTEENLRKTSASQKMAADEERNSLSDFNALADVVIKDYGVHVPQVINELFSMVEFIKDNYLVLFTQKGLMGASRNTSSREQIYLHYQDLVRLLNSYITFGAQPRSGRSSIKEDLMHREYIDILKKYHVFINIVRSSIEIIQKDETLSRVDFTQTVSGIDSNVRIYGLTYQVALEECKNFINEVEEYMMMSNRDFFDAMNIDNQNR
ncbi:MAG: hypothetical protein ACRC9L_06775 [Brevinema sp.]